MGQLVLVIVFDVYVPAATPDQYSSIFAPMKRSIFLYALAMAGLMFLLRAIEYRYWVYDLQEDYAIGSIALLFTLLGLWVGRKWVLQKEVPLTKKSIPVDPATIGLSQREDQVLRLIAAGHSNQEIADTLFLSLNTIKKHTSALFRKLEVERRTQAIEKARVLGIIE